MTFRASFYLKICFEKSYQIYKPVEPWCSFIEIKKICKMLTRQLLIICSLQNRLGPMHLCWVKILSSKRPLRELSLPLQYLCVVSYLPHPAFSKIRKQQMWLDWCGFSCGPLRYCRVCWGGGSIRVQGWAKVRAAGHQKTSKAFLTRPSKLSLRPCEVLWGSCEDKWKVFQSSGLAATSVLVAQVEIRRWMVNWGRTFLRKRYYLHGLTLNR